MKKQILAAAMAAVMLATGCADSTSAKGNGVSAAEKLTCEISPISREDGSGTRTAFVELMGILQRNSEGEMEDMTRPDAEVTNSTSNIMMSVAGYEAAIGYISLGSLNDSVKAVSVDGTFPTAENIKNGSYPLSRPFVICYKAEELDELSLDFISFIISPEGQAVVAAEKYIPIDAGEPYKSKSMRGTVSVNGSTSVAPVMEKLADEYKALNPEVKVEVQQTGSGAGITAAIEGACSIGMSSRALKQEELSSGLTSLTIANDGIVVVINHGNAVDNLTSKQIMKIYTAEINSWGEI